MEYEITLSPKADRDLEEIYAYIAAEKPTAAINFMGRLLQRAKSLVRFPERGHLIRDRPGARFLVYKSYFIVYRVSQDRRRVRVLRFYHAARDIGRLKLGDEKA